MKQFLLTSLIALCISLPDVCAQHFIHVSPSAGKDADMTLKLQHAIDEAASYKGIKPVVIRLQQGDYHLYRQSATAKRYPVSNTTSETENPDPVKHIGLWMKDLKNVTFDGNGARLITHGEMTTFFMDRCERITLKDFTITADDPTVPELTIVEKGERHLTVRIHPQSRYEIKAGRFAFVGDSWRLDGGIAQAYNPQTDATWRTESPLTGLRRAVELEPGLLRFAYDHEPVGRAGLVYQMRDGIRDEVCGCIQYSRNITLERIHFAFLGNFGLVGQMSENLTYRQLIFDPESGSGRTCAGFADFVQMSGCKGRVLIEDSRFSGAHDDPINIHGTHLKVTKFPASNQMVLKYMHHQTYGFQSFLPGNEIEFIHPNTLLPLASAKVKKAVMKNDREIIVTLTRDVPQHLKSMQDLVVENVTYTPEVIVRNNFFSRIPSRGLLVTTRRKVLIENNTFFRMQMSGILIADDARSWFESGMVHDVTIRNNRFIECGTPVIFIAPENNRHEGYVHRNIRIVNNRFLLKGTDAIHAKSVNGLHITNNLFLTSGEESIEKLVTTQECNDTTLRGNIVQDVVR